MNPRKNFEGRITICPVNTSSVISASIQNISLGGIRVKIGISASPVQKGDQLRFIVDEDYFSLEEKGEIVWISPARTLMGVKFSQLTEKTRISLEEFLRLLS